jgi:hypothetical protein
MEKPAKQGVIAVSEKLPPVNKRVIVVCKGYRCLGYLAKDGAWKDAHRHQDLKAVVGWLDAVA